MNNQGGARIIGGLIQKYGCLPNTGDGPIITSFAPKVIAKGIEAEVVRAGEYGWSKVTLHMDIPDALKLARFLRT